MIDKTRSSKK